MERYVLRNLVIGAKILASNFIFKFFPLENTYIDYSVRFYLFYTSRFTINIYQGYQDYNLAITNNYEITPENNDKLRLHITAQCNPVMIFFIIMFGTNLFQEGTQLKQASILIKKYTILIYAAEK